MGLLRTKVAADVEKKPCQDMARPILLTPGMFPHRAAKVGSVALTSQGKDLLHEGLLPENRPHLHGVRGAVPY